jgi:cytochrome P450/NADPH-cytochrome P450 reductase
VIQRFDLSLADPSYTLQIKQTLTVKPKGLHIYARARTTTPVFYATPSSTLKSANISASQASSESASGKPLYVFYGSNTGTSEAFAQRITNGAASYGIWVHLRIIPILTEPQDSARLSALWIPQLGKCR